MNSPLCLLTLSVLLFSVGVFSLRDNIYCPWCVEVSDGFYNGSIEARESAWYCYTANCTGEVTFSTCNNITVFDSELTVFDDCGGYELAEADDDNDCLVDRFLSTIKLPSVEGEEFKIDVHAFSRSDFGEFGLSIDCAVIPPSPSPPPPPFSFCSDCLAVSDGFYNGSIVSEGSAWYCYNASCSGKVRVSTCNENTEFNSLLTVYDSCGGTEIAEADDDDDCLVDSSNTRLSFLEVPLVEGEEYKIQVQGRAYYDFGDYGLSIDCEVPSPSPPPSPSPSPPPTPFTPSRCPTCWAVSNGLTTGSIRPDGERWYCYTANCTGQATLSTCNEITEFDTTITVYDSCEGTEIAYDGNDPDCSFDRQFSTVNLSLVEGEEYKIQVRGNDDDDEYGDFGLSIILQYCTPPSPTPSPPPSPTPSPPPSPTPSPTTSPSSSPTTSPTPTPRSDDDSDSASGKMTVNLVVLIGLVVLFGVLA